MTGLDPSFWLDQPPFAMDAEAKAAALTQTMNALTAWHRQHCPAYARILDVTTDTDGPAATLAQVPFIPVRLFKEMDLRSVPEDRVFKTMTSSGTSGQQVSRIFLDRDTAALQTKILSRLMGEVIGRKRLPMLVIDSPSVLKDRNAFSARGAGILGFSMFGQNVTYALDSEMNLDLAGIEAFLDRHAGQPVFLFGFTFMIWQHFYKPLQALGHRLAIDQGVLLHGGGWKKLQDEAVSSRDFSAALRDCAGIDRVVNYYGMVEQTGSIFLECEQGFLHAPAYAEVIVRDVGDFSMLPPGQTGLVEVLSMIPRSYPGHALLTEDLGRIEALDGCACGRRGTHFTIAGRVARAEVRGCSDTYEPAV